MKGIHHLEVNALVCINSRSTKPEIFPLIRHYWGDALGNEMINCGAIIGSRRVSRSPRRTVCTYPCVQGMQVFMHSPPIAMFVEFLVCWVWVSRKEVLARYLHSLSIASRWRKLCNANHIFTPRFLAKKIHRGQNRSSGGRCSVNNLVTSSTALLEGEGVP